MTVRIPEALYRQLLGEAEASGLSLSAVARVAMEGDHLAAPVAGGRGPATRLTIGGAGRSFPPRDRREDAGVVP